MSRKFLILFVLLIFMGGLLSAQEVIQKRGVKPVVDKKKEENKNQKIALVIGNASYKESPLKNPVNDAIDTVDVLKKCGFEVISMTNVNQLDMEKAVREFSDRLKDGGIGIFYFSGHGVQVEGINYLIPVNSNIQDEIDVKAKAVSANYILGKMDRKSDGMNIMILDACRNNPYARGFRSPSTGLAQMDAPQGSLIVYATSPGKTADDGTGRNGIFTKHFLEMIRETPFEIMVLLRKVRKNVMDETNSKQIPWESSSLLGRFYFSYTDTQLEKIKAEISELQSQIKDHEVQRQGFEKIKSENEEREAARKEEEKKVQLKLKKLEEERLLKEKERQEKLKQEEERFAQEEVQERTERERQKVAAEERLNQLRKKFAEEEAKLKDIKQEVLSVDKARIEVEMLETKIKNIVSLITQEKRKELKQLEEGYDLLIEKLKNKPIPPKDQFESTADYEARVKKHQEKIRAIEERYSSEVSEIQEKYYNEMKSLTKSYKDQKEELKSRKYPVEGLKVELLKYNADKQLYRVALKAPKKQTWFYSISIEPEKAKEIFEKKELIKAEGYYKSLYNTNLLGQAFLIDHLSERNELFLSGIKLRSHYTTLSENVAISVIREKGFFDSRYNPKGEFINEGELVTIEGDKVVIDFSTNLMWHPKFTQKTGKSLIRILPTESREKTTSDFRNSSTYVKIYKWIKKINDSRYAGYNDWRLPTLEEAISYTNALFRKSESTQYTESPNTMNVLMLTGDIHNTKRVWVVNLARGSVDLFRRERDIISVKLVRSLQ